MNIHGLFNAEAILIEETVVVAGEDKGVHTFSKGISPKENIIAWLSSNLLTTMPQSNTWATGTPT